MAKIKYTILIPLNFNDGTPVPDAERNEIYNRFYALANGYTLAGTVAGAYRSKDGSKQVDSSAAIWVAIDAAQEPALRKLVAEICVRLKQESIYLECTGGTVDFIQPLGSGDES